MASQKLDLEVTSVPLSVLKIAPPKTSNVVFERIFTKVEQSTKTTLQDITIKRNNLKAALDCAETNPAVSIKEIQNYLPHLFGLMEAVEKLPSDFSRYLKLPWTTPMGGKFQNSTYSVESFRYEVIMILLGFGISHRNVAADQLSQTNPDLSAISKSLCTAAGVFLFIREVQLGTWTQRPDLGSVIMIESQDEIYEVLAELSLAEAQAMSVRKGVDNKMSNSLLAKLSMDVSSRFARASTICQSMKNNDSLVPFLPVYVQRASELWRAVALQFFSDHNFSAATYGPAVALAQHAKKAVSFEPTSKEKWAQLDSFWKEYAQKKKEISEKTQFYENQNDNIYYDNVPRDIEEIEPKSLAKSVDFTVPPSQEVRVAVSEGTCIIQ